MRTRRRANEQHHNEEFNFATECCAVAIGLDKKTPPVNVFLHAQTLYIDSMYTYVEANSAI